MALHRSMDENSPDKSYENAPHGIQLTDITTENYDSLGERGCDAHIYSTVGEPAIPDSTTISDTLTVGNNTHRSGTPDIASSRLERSCKAIVGDNTHRSGTPDIASSRLGHSYKAIVLALIGVLLLCMIMCTICGIVVYHVIDVKLIPSGGTQVSDELAVDIDFLKTEFTKLLVNMIDINRRLDLMQEKQNTLEITSRDNFTDLNQRLDSMQEKQNTLEITSRDNFTDINRRLDSMQEKQNTSEITSRDYYAAIERRLDALDNLASTEQEKRNTSGDQVAFTAHTATGKEVDKVLTFKYMVLNVGGGYNQTNGRFRCPVAGVYSFTVTLLILDSTSYSRCNIMNNDSTIATISSGNSLTSASVSVLAHLSVGDSVSLGSCYDLKNIRTANLQCSFIGSLIQAD